MKLQLNLEHVEETIRSYLGLKYRLVGIKLIKNTAETAISAQSESRTAFCQLVKEVSTRGDSILYGLENERCPTAQTVLGLKDIKYIRVIHKVTPPETKKILISPLDKMREPPDVVLAILTPRQMMELATVLNRKEGITASATLTGEHACAEFFARPYLKQEPSISLLCNGAREIYADFRDSELIFGAPLETYIRVAETIEQLTKTGGTLCGCRMSDLPSEIVNEFGKIGFLKGTDYFFGKVNGHNVRVYLNKDLDGAPRFVTIHFPIRMRSEESAERLAQRLRALLPRPYFVNRRNYWLDLTARSSEEALGIDLFDGLSVKVSIERSIEKITEYMEKAERIQ